MQRIKKSNEWQNTRLPEALNRQLNVRLPEALKKPEPEGKKKTPDFAKIFTDPMSVGGFGKKVKFGDSTPYSKQADFYDDYIDPFFKSSNPIQGGWDREYEELFGDTGGASKKKPITYPKMEWTNKSIARNKKVAKTCTIERKGADLPGRIPVALLIAGVDLSLALLYFYLTREKSDSSGKKRGGTGGPPHMSTFKHKLREWHDRQAIRNLVRYGSTLMNTQDVLNWLEQERRYERQPESSSPIKDFISDTPQGVMHEVVSLLARSKGWRPIVKGQGDGECGNK